jgi:hypothetical protein
MRQRFVLVVAIIVTVAAVGTIAFAVTRHSPACRGSATYGVGFAHCGGLTTPTNPQHNRPGYAEYTYGDQVPSECEAPTVTTTPHESIAHVCFIAGSAMSAPSP